MTQMTDISNGHGVIGGRYKPTGVTLLRLIGVGQRGRDKIFPVLLGAHVFTLLFSQRQLTIPECPCFRRNLGVPKD